MIPSQERRSYYKSHTTNRITKSMQKKTEAPRDQNENRQTSKGNQDENITK